MPGKNAPLLVMHGTHDTVVPYFAAVLPCTNTIAVGNVCEQQVFPQAGHSLDAEPRGTASASFLYRHVIAAPRAPSDFVDLAATTRGETVTVTGRLVDGGGVPIAGARVLGQATDGWSSARTAPDGFFTLTVAAPDHSHSTVVAVRYDGEFQGSGLLARNRAPVQESVVASWGQPAS